jgi:hypothetical protein
MTEILHIVILCMYADNNECLHANFTVPPHSEPELALNPASHRPEYEKYLHRGCNIMKFGAWVPAFQKKLLPLSSG